MIQICLFLLPPTVILFLLLMVWRVFTRGTLINQTLVNGIIFWNVSFYLLFGSLSDKVASHRRGCISGITIFPVCTCTWVFHCHNFWYFFALVVEKTDTYFYNQLEISFFEFIYMKNGSYNCLKQYRPCKLFCLKTQKNPTQNTQTPTGQKVLLKEQDCV